MKVFNQLSQIPVFNNAVLTIGTFDGVHLGHAKIIDQMCREAEAVHGETVLISFYPHPRRVIHTDKEQLFILNTPSEKRHLLQAKGIENLVIVPFNQEFAQMEAEDYIESFLVKYFNPQSIIIGYDHRFGKNRKGDFHLLESCAEKFNFRVIEIPEKVQEDIVISSTRIRKAILGTDIENANDLLGYAYFFSGRIVRGKQLGRTIGYPTANLQPEDAEKLIPGNAVYAVRVSLEGDEHSYKGMMNIGIRPTIDGTTRSIEVNIFDFAEDCYDKIMTVTLVKRLRSEMKFEGLEMLKNQLAKDKIDSMIALQ